MELILPVSKDGKPLRGCLDSSTAIILKNAGLLKAFCSKWELVTTDMILSEIEKGDGGKDIAAILTEFCVIEYVSEETPFKKGEDSIFMLFQKKKADIIFSDDGRFLEYCKKRNILHYSSIMVPYLMYNIKELPKIKALDYTRIIASKGRFAGWILDYVNALWKKEGSIPDTR